MARPRNNAKHVSAAVGKLSMTIDGLLGTLQRTEESAANANQTAPTPRKQGQRGPGKGQPEAHGGAQSVVGQAHAGAAEGEDSRMLAGRGLKLRR